MYETYSRSRIHEAYPQLRAHAFKHWDRIFGSWSHSTDRRPLVLYVSVDLFFRTQDSETRICVGVPRRFPTLFHNKKLINTRCIGFPNAIYSYWSDALCAVFRRW